MMEQGQTGAARMLHGQPKVFTLINGKLSKAKQIYCELFVLMQIGHKRASKYPFKIIFRHQRDSNFLGHFLR